MPTAAPQVRFNFVSEHGDGFGLTQWLRSEGYSVRMWIHSSEAIEVGDGLVEKVGDFLDLVEDAAPREDIFIFDTSGMGVFADYLRSREFDVLGGSVEADRLERSRDLAMEVMNGAGIEIPPTFTFPNFTTAIDFVSRDPRRLVYKPSGKLGDLTGSHVSFDQEDMLDFLRVQQKDHDVDGIRFDLQVFTEGQEISSEAWFDGVKFLPLFNHTLERKQLMNGNKGPSGGCTGNIVWACSGWDCPICQRGTLKLERYLRSIAYVGPIDLNAILTKDSIFGLEFTPRFGYDATPTLLGELVRGGIGEFLSAIAIGATPFSQNSFSDSFLINDKVAGSLRVTLPPWPTEKHTAQSDIPLGGVDLDDISDTYLYNVKRASSETKSSELCSAGAWGILLLLNGRGHSVDSVYSKLYKRAGELRIPDMQYRTDLAKQFSRDLEQLQEFGLLTEQVEEKIGA